MMADSIQPQSEIFMKIYRLCYDQNDVMTEPGVRYFSAFKDMKKWSKNELKQDLDGPGISHFVHSVPTDKAGLINWLNHYCSEVY